MNNIMALSEAGNTVQEVTNPRHALHQPACQQPVTCPEAAHPTPPQGLLV